MGNQTGRPLPTSPRQGTVRPHHYTNVRVSLGTSLGLCEICGLTARECVAAYRPKR